MNRSYPAITDYAMEDFAKGNVPQPDYFIHPNADVSSDCIIGEGTRIWSGAVVRNHTVLGQNVSVGNGCALEGCTVGSDTKINPHVLAGPGIHIGKRCFIAGSVILTNDGWPSPDRDAHGGWYPKLGWITIKVGDDTAICSLAVIMPGVVIGDRCLVAAQACVTADLPDDHMWTRDGKIKRIDPSKILRMRDAKV